MHYCGTNNPHWERQVAHQVRWGLNVWRGPYFFEGHWTGPRYLHFLRQELPLLLEDVPLQDRVTMWFQQNGAPPHSILPVRNHLNEELPGKWIGRGGPVSWPARAPDVTPLDFFL